MICKPQPRRFPASLLALMCLSLLVEIKITQGLEAALGLAAVGIHIPLGSTEIKPTPKGLFLVVVLEVVIFERLSLAGVGRGAAQEPGWELPHSCSPEKKKQKPKTLKKAWQERLEEFQNISLAKHFFQWKNYFLSLKFN